MNKLIAILGIILISLAMGFSYALTKRNSQANLQQGVKSQLLQVVNELTITLERHSYLPSLLSSDIKIRNFLLLNSDDADYLNKQLTTNLSLELTNNISESSAIYIMRPDGLTVASSNWESSNSFIGKNFSFRPYFQQAMQNTLGRYYAVGAISGERGYFFASSVLHEGHVIGVIAVKVAIDDIEFIWGQGSYDFMVTDPAGVIFLSSQEGWNLHSLAPLSKKTRERFIKSRRYGLRPITTLQNTRLDSDLSHFQSIRLLNEDYEMLSQKMLLVDWDVRVMASHRKMKKTIFNSLLITALILSLLTALAVLLWKTQQQHKKDQRQVREELEEKVIQRTKALKQTQEELIQAAKMAALGQLSAGITHEINNPLTAIRAYADNAKQFLDKGNIEMVKSNLTEINALTENMASITRQLKSFSRKSKGLTKPVLLGAVIKNALAVVQPQLTSGSVICHWSNQLHGNHRSVLADEVWLSQILVNLFTNAISATQKNEQAEIWVEIKTEEPAMLCIQVSDNGVGIEENTLPHIFEPFFTTKPSSKGLGLGLSISFNLAKDMNGSLGAENTKTGAKFSLCLPSVN